MKIVKPYYKILHPVGWDSWLKNLLEHVEYCARISHRSEDRITHDSAQKLLKFIVMEKGDFSVIEHSMMTVEFLVDRGVTHELVRHRLFSFTQESTRFVNYEKKMPPSFIYPQVDIMCEHCLHGNELDFLDDDGLWRHRIGQTDNYILCKYDSDWLDTIHNCELNYRRLVKQGWRPQEARSLFPNALASKIVVTGNFRNWRHLLNMRTSQETHPQFKQVTIPFLKELQENEYIGWLFSDIVPNGKQSEMQRNMR